jgi:hypothetical protein
MPDYFVLLGSVGSLMVGGLVGFGGRLILTVSFFRPGGLGSSSSSPKAWVVMVPRGGRGGLMEPELEGFGSGCGFSFSISGSNGLRLRW